MMLSGISTVAMSARVSDADDGPGTMMPVPKSRMPQGMQLASLESTLIVEPSIRQNEYPISTFAERFLFRPAAPEENVDTDAAPAPDASVSGKTAAGARAPTARSAAKLPPATAATPVPTPAPTKKIRTADLAQDPSLHVDATNKTAIYDISAHVVYLPSGRRLEAHSGLGPHMDDTRYVNLKARGPTPPNVYQLTMREELFHGVRAIRLNPVDETRMYGRDGILAHTYMLGPNGQSNGCISFADYNAFLNAFQRGEIDRIVVVERLGNRPDAQTTGDWLSDKVKDVFWRS
jgi:Tlde1 domain